MQNLKKKFCLIKVRRVVYIKVGRVFPSIHYFSSNVANLDLEKLPALVCYEISLSQNNVTMTTHMTSLL